MSNWENKNEEGEMKRDEKKMNSKEKKEWKWKGAMKKNVKEKENEK